MPREKFAWASLSDEELLEVRLKDLKVTVEGTWLEDCLLALHDELAQSGIRVWPHAWISSEWFSPENTTGIAIPFYLAHPRLMRLERKMIIDVEGGTWTECMAILRHEAGHVVQHAYALSRRRQWQRLFGPTSRRYPRYYRPNPASRHYVQHLRLWYAQSHPDEDFAETFAVWLRPRSNWRTRYAGWPALKKLEYVDALMGEISNAATAAQKPRKSRSAQRSHRNARRALQEEAGALRVRHAEDLRPRFAPVVFGRSKAPALRGGVIVPAAQSRQSAQAGGEVDRRISAHARRRARRHDRALPRA